jgi:hypothetical protein
MEGSGPILYWDAIRNFSDKTEETHESVRRYSFPLSQDFDSKTKALIPPAQTTRFFIPNSFPDNLGWEFCFLKRLFMQFWCINFVVS